jgi:plasmid stability protein
MSENTRRSRLLHESLAPYTGRERDASGGVTKLSISLPTDLVEVVRATAAGHGLSVSATIAAALRRTIGDAEQVALDAALAAQADENLEFARAYGPISAELLVKLEW